MRKANAPLDHIERLDDGVYAGLRVVAGLLLNQVGQHLAVRRGLEQAPLVLEPAAQQVRIDQIAVVGQGEVPREVAEQKGLHILDPPAPRSRVADVSHGHAPLERAQVGLVENFRHEPFALDAAQRPGVVHAHDAAPLLPPVLQGVQPVVGEFGGARNPEDPEHAALLVQLPIRRRPDHPLCVAFSSRAKISS